MPAADRALGIDLVEIDLAAKRFEDRPAEDLLAWAAEQFGSRMVLTCSWQKQSSILVHLLAQVAPETRIVEVDTGLLFDESHDTRRQLAERYGIEVETIRPVQTLAEQAAEHGARLWERDSDLCCSLRKVKPFEIALKGAEAWVSGVRRDQSATRRGIRKVQLDEKRGVVKIQPLADWTDRDCWRFIVEHAIPYNALHDRNYPSVGCTPCTRAVRPGEDERAGRWAGTGKTECGLHG